MKVLISLSIMILSLSTMMAQVIVSPSIIFMDPATGTGSVTLKNNSESDKEVEISFRYGYSGTDSSGKSTIIYDDTTPAPVTSLVPNITSFPKKLLLAANSEQTVRLLVRGLRDAPDGVYWARLSAKAQDVAKQIDSTTIDKISAQFIFVMETLNPVLYYKGKTEMDVEILNITSEIDSANINVNLTCERKGNAPFFGTANLTLINESGEKLETKSARIAVYFTNTATFSFNKSDVKPGNYTAEVAFDNKRDDIMEEYRLPYKKPAKVISLVIPNN